MKIKVSLMILGIVLVVLIGGVLYLFGGQDSVSTNQVFGEKVVKDVEEESVELEVELDPMPAFSFQDLSGVVVTSEGLLGTPLVVNAWATWCPFCVNELPDFAEIQTEFGDKVKIIAINRQEDISDQEEFLSDFGIREDLLYLVDPNDDFYKSIGGFSMPETIFVNEDGNIVEHVRGPIKLDQMRELINSIL